MMKSRRCACSETSRGVCPARLRERGHIPARTASRLHWASQGSVMLSLFLKLMRHRKSCTQWLNCFFLLFGYCALGSVAYFFLEPEWKPSEALYFTFTIVSTVGYGCISPTNYASRVFTMFYTVMSVPLISGALASVWDPIVTYPYKRFVEPMFLRLRFFNPDGDDPLRPISAFHFYARGIGPIFMFAHMGACLLLALCALAFGQIDHSFANTLSSSGKLHAFDALYFTVITSSTVGFGDICPLTDSARTFVTFMASIGIAILSFFINSVAQLQDERAAMLTRAKRLQLEASGAMLADRFDAFDKDGDGKIDRFEYVVAMLMALELVNSEDCERFLRSFDSMDADKDGRLTRCEIEVALDARAREIAEHEGSKATSSRVAVGASIDVVSPSAEGGAMHSVSPDQRHPPADPLAF